MRLAFLLALAAAPMTDQHPTDARAAAAIQATRPSQNFQAAPLQLGLAPIAPFQPGVSVQAPPSLVASPPVRETQLRNRRTGVTCTLRVIRAGASMDPGILVPPFRGAREADPIVRNDVAPCVE